MRPLASNLRRVVIILIMASLISCGGGGGGSSSVSVTDVTTLSFPAESAYKTLVANGLPTTNFIVTTTSPTCSGSGTRTTAPATTPATFEGVLALSAVETFTFSLPTCPVQPASGSGTNYYDINYVPLGFAGSAIYGVFRNPLSMPTSVTVGASGTAVGIVDLYTDSTKTTGLGTVVYSYVVEADTATNAIVNLITRSYDLSSTLLWTEQDRYRIAMVGALTPVSSDIQYESASGSTMHLVLTYN